MQAGYFQPLNAPYRMAWMWWVILLSFQQILFFENNLQMTLLTDILLALVILSFYFLIRQRRFFIVGTVVHFTKDFRLVTEQIDLRYVNSVKVNKWTVQFIYIGIKYRFFIYGKSNQLIRELFAEKIAMESKGSH